MSVAKRTVRDDDPPPPPEPVPPPEEYAPPPAPSQAAKPSVQKPTATAQKQTVANTSAQSDVKGADEGEFRHLSAQNVSGLKLIGSIATHLRKKGTREAARARELLSRGVTVKERSDAVTFVTPDEQFIPMSDDAVIKELAEALSELGINKPVRIDKTLEDLMADDQEAARELFGRDLVIVIN